MEDNVVTKGNHKSKERLGFKRRREAFESRLPGNSVLEVINNFLDHRLPSLYEKIKNESSLFLCPKIYISQIIEQRIKTTYPSLEFRVCTQNYLWRNDKLLFKPDNLIIITGLTTSLRSNRYEYLKQNRFDKLFLIPALHHAKIYYFSEDIDWQKFKDHNVNTPQPNLLIDDNCIIDLEPIKKNKK